MLNLYWINESKVTHIYAYYPLLSYFFKHFEIEFKNRKNKA